MRTSYRNAALAAVVAAAVALLAFDPARRERQRPAQERAPAAEPNRIPVEFPQRQPLAAFPDEPFDSRPAGPPVPPASAAPAAPGAPPMPYRYAGRLAHADRVEVYLAKGDSMTPITPGTTIDGVYRVDSIGETRIALTYLPLGQQQSIAIESDATIAETGRASQQPATPLARPLRAVPPSVATPPERR